jgi:hypothetical protein
MASVVYPVLSMSGSAGAIALSIRISIPSRLSSEYLDKTSNRRRSVHFFLLWDVERVCLCYSSCSVFRTPTTMRIALLVANEHSPSRQIPAMGRTSRFDFDSTQCRPEPSCRLRSPAQDQALLGASKRGTGVLPPLDYGLLVVVSVFVLPTNFVVFYAAPRPQEEGMMMLNQFSVTKTGSS